MATYVEVVKFESEKAQNVIRLIKSGEFYRAYNHSAWLFHRCIAEHKVIRKYIKTLGCDVYYLGFPEKSLFGNIGERESSKTELGFDIILSATEVPDSGYDEWCSSIAIESSSKSDFYSLPMAGADAEKEVLRRIKTFPLENKTMVECTVFLAELRKLLNNT